MLGFMDFVQDAFLEATNWDKDNSYGALNATSQNILDFTTPRSLRLNVSALSSPQFASSYSIGSIGLLDGSISYLYSSLGLGHVSASSRSTRLRPLIAGYRRIQQLVQPDIADWWEIWQQGSRIDRRDALLYGRLFLPQSTVEGLYLRRLGPTNQLKVACVSDSELPNGGSALVHLQYDAAKYCTEYLCSTDSALLGFRGLWNFGSELSQDGQHRATRSRLDGEAIKQRSLPEERQSSSTLQGRFSAGGEVYYGLLNKSGGMSLGLRFSTLPSYSGFPYTMTLTLNPLMGNLSSAYSLSASPNLALSSRLNFNVYSYESELQLGTEIWWKRPQQANDGLEWARNKLGQGYPVSKTDAEAEKAAPSGCLKSRLDQNGHLAILWEGRIKEMLYSCGFNIDMHGGEKMFRGLGLELHYSP